MPIAFDAATGPAGSSGSTKTFSHTCTGTNLLLYVDIWVAGVNSDAVTGVTYAGVSMTRVDALYPVSAPGGLGDHSYYTYALVGPATGANNVVVTFIASEYADAGATSYTGVSQTGFPDSHVATYNVAILASPYAPTTTVVASNCWLHCNFAIYDAAGLAAGTGTTNRFSLDGGVVISADSNGTVGTGAQALAEAFSHTPNQMTAILSSFAPPSVAVPNSGFFNLMG